MVRAEPTVYDAAADDDDDDDDDDDVMSMWQVDSSRDLYTKPTSDSDPYSFVFVSKDWMTTTDRLLIIIHGSGVVRAGQWARRSAHVCMN